MSKDFKFEKLDHRLLKGLYYKKTEENSYMKPQAAPAKKQ